MSLWRYTLTAPSLCLGERTKKGTYRASIECCIPYSQITGALRARYGTDQGHIHAVGLLTSFNRQTVMRGVRDRAAGLSTLPLEAEVLVNVKGTIYVAVNEYTTHLPTEIDLEMGAFRSQGIGRCHLSRPVTQRPLPVTPTVQGRLAVRLPEDKIVLRLFGIEEVIMPIWGYLFEPDEQHVGGQYVRALFEGSIVHGPAMLLGKEEKDGQ
ncbi:MAG: hypothetical protein FJ014_12365 [Chloroflexi bacterium]|nr:hypothetical protein [Chloroflexota bacterium]